jgi:TnpA family transposase
MQCASAMPESQHVQQLQAALRQTAADTDRGYPDNAHLEIENGVPVLKRLKRKPDPDGRARLEQMIKDRLEPTGIMEVLVDTQHWLNWTQRFGPISGHDAKLDDPVGRYIATTFCYGYNFGPTQTARSVRGLDRRQVSFVNQRHVTEQKLNEAIDVVIDGYRAFPLPEAWGLGKTASADGTQWDLYPQNLMSEYHIRYGDWGGLGYYLVADDYIALFSRFSTCGSWEGHYILDFVTETDEAFHPEIIHADTQGQSAAIFGLAHLLGIQLMPRIRHWKDLHLYRASSEDRYEPIDALLTKEVDWELIAAFWPDMLRVAVSIAEGRVTPSTVLRRLATYSRKNKLYFAFRELGCAVRTIFLLQFLSDADLRHKIQAATNKSEAFNKFAQWAFFAGGGVIAENLRDEQRKIIKYNHLVTNLLIYHNVVNMSRALARLRMEGHEVNPDALAALSPYQTEHINRYGSYKLRLDRMPEPIDEVLRRPPQREKSKVVVMTRAQGHG